MDLCIVQPRARNVPKSAVQMFENRTGSTRVTVKNFVNTVPLKSRCSSFAPCVFPRPHSRPLYAQTYNRPKILAIKYSGPSEGVRQSVMDLAAGTDLSDSISKMGRDVDRQVGSMDRGLQESFRSLDQDLDRFSRSIKDFGANTERELRQQPRVEVPGNSFTRERSYQQEVQGGWTRAYESSMAGSAGGGSGLLMFSIILAGAYVAVARKFWDNFRSTKYKASSRLSMSLQWPVLIADAGFRTEMRKAFNLKPKGLKSSREKERKEEEF